MPMERGRYFKQLFGMRRVFAARFANALRPPSLVRATL